jgi:hypothetical protein
LQVVSSHSCSDLFHSFISLFGVFSAVFSARLGSERRVKQLSSYRCFPCLFILSCTASNHFSKAISIMEGDSAASTSGRGPDTASAPAAINPSQSSEEPKSSPAPSMSGALPAGDVKNSAKDTDEGEGMQIIWSTSFSCAPPLYNRTD